MMTRNEIISEHLRDGGGPRYCDPVATWTGNPVAMGETEDRVYDTQADAICAAEAYALSRRVDPAFKDAEPC